MFAAFTLHNATTHNNGTDSSGEPEHALVPQKRKRLGRKSGGGSAAAAVVVPKPDKKKKGSRKDQLDELMAEDQTSLAELGLGHAY